MFYTLSTISWPHLLGLKSFAQYIYSQIYSQEICTILVLCLRERLTEQMWFFQQNKVLMGWMIFLRNEAAHFFINCRVPGIFSQENGSFSFSWYISLNFIYSAPIKKQRQIYVTYKLWKQLLTWFKVSRLVQQIDELQYTLEYFLRLHYSALLL